MHLHWLELFYHVAEHRGISQAARHMPYGIQASAISEQVGRLEDQIGRRLFERQPFRLNPEGERLFALLKPFFAELRTLEADFSGNGHRQLRIAAAETVLEHHLPPVLGALEQLQPGVHFALRSAPCEIMCAWLGNGNVDLVITALGGTPPAGLASRAVLRLPLVLLVHRRSAIVSAEELWRQRVIREPLICPAAAEGVGQVFYRGLKQGRLRWPASIEASSVASVASYVARGQGVGVSLDLPSLVRHPDVRVVALKGFDPVAVTLLWRPPDSTRLRTLVDIMEARARLLCAGDFASAGKACGVPS